MNYFNLLKRNKKLRASQRYWTRKKIITSTALSLIFLAWFIPYVPALKWDHVNVTRWEKKRGEVHVDVGPKVKGWVKLSGISKHVLNSIISSEDGRFYQHHGIDLVEIWHSFETNIRKGKIARGGSTITQQVIKMAFLDRSRSFIRKAREALGALIAELLLSKKEILQWYINLAEFGDAVYGIEKASWHYFHTKPQFLSIEQGVHLALVLPSPNGWSVGLRRKNLTEFGHQRFRRILNLMKMNGYINKAEYQQAMARGNFGSPIKGYKPNIEEDPFDEGSQETENTAGDFIAEEQKKQPSQESKQVNESSIISSPLRGSTPSFTNPADPPIMSQQADSETADRIEQLDSLEQIETGYPEQKDNSLQSQDESQADDSKQLDSMKQSEDLKQSVQTPDSTD